VPTGEVYYMGKWEQALWKKPVKRTYGGYMEFTDREVDTIREALDFFMQCRDNKESEEEQAEAILDRIDLERIKQSLKDRALTSR
jgi:ABC-type multidrug transport system ATPase subunit